MGDVINKCLKKRQHMLQSAHRAFPYQHSSSMQEKKIRLCGKPFANNDAQR